MAKQYSITQAVAVAMLQAWAAQADAGTAAVINIYSGTPPANAEAALSGNTQLAQLVCNATIIASYSDAGTAARATFAAITPDASADATGVATFYRVLTQNGGTVVAQGSVGTTDADLIVNTTSFTAGSQVSITSATLDMLKS